MTFVAFTILGPLAAVVAILLIRRAAPALALLGVGISLAGAMIVLVNVAGGARYTATLPGLPDLPLRLIATPLTAVLATIVAVVGAFVMVYAVGYMEEDGGKVRFFAQMSFFVAAMETLVFAGDWVLLLAAWEMIGLASYMLIGFWHEREGVGEAATRAFLYTRTADLGLYVGIFILVAQAGSTEIPRTLEVGGAAAFTASLLILLAAAGKSAQTPLQGWLQAAMAGPTPVSALLHSATLVAAGAILLIRAFPLFPAHGAANRGRLGRRDGNSSRAHGRRRPGPEAAARGLHLQPVRFHAAGRRCGISGGRPRPPHRPRGDEELPLPRVRGIPACPRLYGFLETRGRRAGAAARLRRVRRGGAGSRRRAAARRVLVQRRRNSRDVRIALRLVALPAGARREPR